MRVEPVFEWKWKSFGLGFEAHYYKNLSFTRFRREFRLDLHLLWWEYRLTVSWKEHDWRKLREQVNATQRVQRPTVVP